MNPSPNPENMQQAIYSSHPSQKAHNAVHTIRPVTCKNPLKAVAVHTLFKHLLLEQGQKNKASQASSPCRRQLSMSWMPLQSAAQPAFRPVCEL